MNIKGSRILVTGAAGFIGSHLVDRLLEKNPKHIIIFDNLECGTKKNLKNALKDKRVKFVLGDIRNIKEVDKVMKKIDLVFHEAALRHTQCTNDPRSGHEVLVDG